jgi:Lon protease-like protein
MARLPLFPLPVVLFPGALLPLHIFEPRYRQLLADCIAGNHRFGLLPPGPGGQPPAPGTVGCIALVRAVQAFEDGRSNIVVSGDGRFELTQLVPTETPYLMGEVTELDDLPDVLVPSATETAALRELATRYARAIAVLNDAPDAANFSDDLGRLTFQLASLLEWSDAAKQQFLTIRSATERVERLLHVLPGMVESAENRAKVHRRAKTNGSGALH